MRTAAAALALAAASLGLSAGPARAASAPKQWYVDTLGFPAAWRVSKGAGVTVADIGPGVDPNAADLRGALVPGVDLSGAGFATAQGPDPLADTTDLNPAYDGTQVAAILAGRGKLGTGVEGAAPRAEVMPVRIGSESPFPNSGPDRIAAGVDYAVAHGAKVILVPAGWDGKGSAVLATAVARAEAAGVVLVAGVGNNGTQGSPATEPSSLAGVMGVGGTVQGGGEWAASTAGPQVAVAAPARPLRVPAKTGGYTAAYSTHDSAAIVAGEAALLRAAHPGWTAGQIVRVILDSASGKGKRLDDKTGYGIVDPARALAAGTPADLADPLGAVPLPAPSASARTSPSASASTATVVQGLGSHGGSAAGKGGGSSSSLPLVLGGALGAAVLIAAGAVWIVTRRRNRGNYFSEPAYAPPPPILPDAYIDPGAYSAPGTPPAPGPFPQQPQYVPPSAQYDPPGGYVGRGGGPASQDEMPTQEFRRPEGFGG